MATIHLNETTTSTPEQFVAGLTDFGPGRSKLFGRRVDGYLKVHDQGPDHADATEGSSGIWERLQYDWSDPNRVVMTTTDSNTWGGSSGHTYTLTPKPDGTTDVDVVVVREGKNIKVARSGSSASAYWERSWQRPSRPSKPAATGERGGSHLAVSVRSPPEPALQVDGTITGRMHPGEALEVHLRPRAGLVVRVDPERCQRRSQVKVSLLDLPFLPEEMRDLPPGGDPVVLTLDS